MSKGAEQALHPRKPPEGAAAAAAHLSPNGTCAGTGKPLALMGWLVWKPPVSSCWVLPLTEPRTAAATACSASTCRP